MITRDSASFRDPDGFVFRREGILYRQIMDTYAEDYDFLMSSGLYDNLVKDGHLIRHTEVQVTPAVQVGGYRVLQPETVPFVSYPYEWSFSELKDAALLTLEIQKRALEREMSLKDCSAFNVQFLGSKPTFIDTSSFEKLQDGKPWVAYQQFCRHFLAPLALVSYTDIKLLQLFRSFIDGIPLDLASTLLPSVSLLKPSLLTHIHIHAKTQKRYGSGSTPKKTGGLKMSKMAHFGLVDSLKNAVRKLHWKAGKTEWGDYYSETNYSGSGMSHKKNIIHEYLQQIKPSLVWDLGANTGEFSRIAAQTNASVLSFDIDPLAVERNYMAEKKTGDGKILPLFLDLTNPSPSLGWAHQERMSLRERGPADVILALALIHHLAISNNVPLDMLAAFFADNCSNLIVEFVPKNDSQVKRLLATREDIFPDYTQSGFEQAFSKCFEIISSVKVSESERTLYQMKKLSSAA